MNALARLRRSRFAQAVLLLAVLCGAGIALYLDERETRQQTHELAVPGTPDWVELDVTTQEVDPGTGKVTLYVVPVPHGNLAQPGAPAAFSRQVEITAESATATVFRTVPGRAGPPQQVPSEIFSGTETDYPFDRYRAETVFSAHDAAGPVPVGLFSGDSDPFFFVTPTGTVLPSGATLMEMKATRARSTFILAWFMIAAMWALALAVLAAVEVLHRSGQGLVWPSLGWMAATLFALIGMRNAAPGGPPIGSLIDYVAFFWAEGIIAASLTVAVVTGTRVERRAREDAVPP
ncbi:DUF4436 family protein [Kitasatospora sp. NPDC088391]|uniref:DUF4436 family protein n=1 Tax=Kitasatospora sp. NPDC088391 TaxID=3364074 RepID=UPI003820EE70